MATIRLKQFMNPIAQQDTEFYIGQAQPLGLKKENAHIDEWFEKDGTPSDELHHLGQPLDQKNWINLLLIDFKGENELVAKLFKRYPLSTSCRWKMKHCMAVAFKRIFIVKQTKINRRRRLCRGLQFTEPLANILFQF